MIRRGLSRLCKTRWSSSSMASSGMPRTGTAIMVSGGSTSAAHSGSPIPTMARSSGIRRPASRTALSAPSIIKLFETSRVADSADWSSRRRTASWAASERNPALDGVRLESGCAHRHRVSCEAHCGGVGATAGVRDGAGRQARRESGHHVFPLRSRAMIVFMISDGNLGSLVLLARNPSTCTNLVGAVGLEPTNPSLVRCVCTVAGRRLLSPDMAPTCDNHGWL